MKTTPFLGFGVLFWVSGAPAHTNFEESLCMIFERDIYPAYSYQTSESVLAPPPT